MNKICTSIVQSKKLIELGIDVNTADMYYPNRTDIQYQDALPIGMKHSNSLLAQEIPAWSLSALLGILPMHIIINGSMYKFSMVKGFNKQGETYRLGYKTNNSFLFETSWYNEPIDAAFEMVCWLNENGKI